MSGHLVVMRGLPGSGKSTVALNCANEIEKAAIASRDGFREILAPGNAGNLPRELEDMVTKLQRQCVENTLQMGYTVFIADTNLPHRRVREWLGLAEQVGATWYVNDLTDVPLETCLERNQLRERKVPESVIRTMHARYIASGNAKPEQWIPVGTAEPTKGELYVPNASKPLAIIVDIDGTVAKMGDRSPYDYTRVSEDTGNWPIIDYVDSIAETVVSSGGGPVGFPEIIFVSGRPESCRADTEDWLAGRMHVNFALFMRSNQEHADGVKDYDVKLGIFDREIRHNYNVHSVIDDRTQVVKMWRSLGLTVLQVDDGNF